MATMNGTLSPAKDLYSSCLAKFSAVNVIRVANGAQVMDSIRMSATNVLATGIVMPAKMNVPRIITLTRRSANASHVTRNAAGAMDHPPVIVSSAGTSKSSPTVCPARTQPTLIAHRTALPITRTNATNGVLIVQSINNMRRQLVEPICRG